MAEPDDKPVDRRRFFRLGLAELLRPLASASSPLQKMANQFAQLENIGKSAHQSTNASGQRHALPLDIWLRPPGALPDQQFRDRCSRGGECVKACPAHCIKIDVTGKKGNGAPYIEPNEMACVVCDGLYCMKACPSGALELKGIGDIDMGTAVWHSQTCVRSKGEPCTICVDHCPLGSAAIELRNGNVAVNPLGCIGCGVCQHDCPTTPKSISVIPIAAKTAPR